MSLENLFVYGTLMDSDLRKKLLGRNKDGIPDSLNGFKKMEIIISKEKYPALIRNGNSNNIDGIVIRVSDEELRLLDEYEGESYKREKVKLNSETEALVYVFNSH